MTVEQTAYTLGKGMRAYNRRFHIKLNIKVLSTRHGSHFRPVNSRMAQMATQIRIKK